MASTYTPIATQTLSGSAASVTFSSISGAYTDLVIVANILATSDANNIRIQVNGDTGTNYSVTYVAGSGSAASSGRESPATGWLWSVGPLGSPNASNPAPQIMQINNYSNTTTHKTMLSRQGINAATYNGVAAQVGLWRNTAAINSINWTIQSTTFASGSTFTLYGIKAAV